MYTLTCRDCPRVAFGSISSAVGGVNVAAVRRSWSQTVDLSAQSGEGLVETLRRETKQLIHIQNIAVRANHTGPLKLYRCT